MAQDSSSKPPQAPSRTSASAATQSARPATAREEPAVPIAIRLKALNSMPEGADASRELTLEIPPENATPASTLIVRNAVVQEGMSVAAAKIQLP